MPSKDSLLLIQDDRELVGVLCRGREILLSHRVACAPAEPEDSRKAVAALSHALSSAGYKVPGDVRLCLGARNVLFRRWQFPFRSQHKAAQALGLMLNTEFPMNEGEGQLEHRWMLRGDERKELHGVSVSLLHGAAKPLLDALAAQEIQPILATVDPFPLVWGLPRTLRGTSLLLHCHTSHTTLALVQNGFVRAVHVVECGWEHAAELVSCCRREALPALEGLPPAPERLLLYGLPFLISDKDREFSAAFGMPAVIPGRDIPLAGSPARLGETEPERLLALCLAGLPLPAPWRRPSCPSFHREASRPVFSGPRRRILGAACCAGLLGFAFLFSVWAEGAAWQRRATLHEEHARRLFSQTIPEMRASISPAQMERILKDRLRALQRSTPSSFPVMRLLQELHAAVPPKLNVRIDRLRLDARRCALSGNAAGYEDVDALCDALSGVAGIREVNIRSAAQESRRPETGRAPSARIIFELELTREDAHE